jgi:hypothetical protein
MPSLNLVKHLKDLTFTMEKNPIGAICLVTMVYFLTVRVGFHS